jgi:hypothetical protein
MTKPRMPSRLGDAGRRLWKAVVGEFDLHEHELAVLRQACHTADHCDRLEQQLATSDALTTTAAGNPKINPLLAEARLQRLLLGRLLVSLRIPLGDEDNSDRRTGQHRGPRGFYGTAQ